MSAERLLVLLVFFVIGVLAGLFGIGPAIWRLIRRE